MLRPRGLTIAKDGLILLATITAVQLWNSVAPITADPTAVSSFNGGVLYTMGGNGNGTSYLRAYQEGSWATLGQWSIPALSTGGAVQATVRGTAYDGGYLYIAAGGDAASGSPAAGQLIKWDLVNNTQVFAKSYSFGVDQLAACNGYVYMPTGEGSTGTSWEVLKESDGSVVGQLSGPTAGPHNTICTTASGTTHVYLAGRCLHGSCNGSYLAQGSCTAGNPCLSANGTTVGPGLGTGGIRPFTVGRGLSRVWETWSYYRGFSIGDLSTGKILASENFGSYSGTSTTPSHGISVDPANKEVYVLDMPSNQIEVWSAADSPAHLATINLTAFYGGKDSSSVCGYDCRKVGWVQHSFDGKYVIVGEAGDIISTASQTLVVSATAGPSQLHTDLFNTRHGYIDVDWSNGAPTSGSHFGLGG